MSGTVSPFRDDRDTGGFFEGVAARELRLCRCSTCGQLLHLPRSICDRCHGTAVQWDAVGQTGRLYSWTVVQHQVHPAFDVPFTVVLVELQDEPSVRLVGRLPGEPPLVAGMPMVVSFDELDDGQLLLNWRLDDSRG